MITIAFLDAKRPFTKKVLERISFSKITHSVSLDELQQTEQRLNLSAFVSSSMYDTFKSLIPIELV